MGMIEDAIREYATYEARTTDPATPAAGSGLVYFKNGKVHAIDDAGAVTEYGTGGGGGQIAAGQYTGDGTVDRTIPLAFTPKLVILMQVNAMHVSNVGANNVGARLVGTQSVGTSNPIRPALTTNGFIVSGTGSSLHTNHSAVVYDYVAIG